MVGNVPNRSVVKSGLRDDLNIIVDYSLHCRTMVKTLTMYGKCFLYQTK